MSSVTFDVLAANLSGSAGDGDTRGMILVIKAQEFAAREKHSDAALRMFGVLAASLLPHVDEAAAVALAREVAHRVDCPAPLIGALVERRDAASLIAIRSAPHLDPWRRVLALTSGIPEALALAGRADLDAEAVAILLARGDFALTKALVANLAIDLPPDALDALIDRARGERMLGRLLLSSDRDLGPRRTALFLAADPTERRAMLEGVAALARLDQGAHPLVVAEAEHAAIESAALAGDHAALVAHVAGAAGLDAGLAAGIADDATGQALAILMRSIGMPEASAERCLLFVHTRLGGSAASALSLVRYYRRLGDATARRLLALVAGRQELPRPEERPPAPPLSGPTVRQRHRAPNHSEARRTGSDTAKAAATRAL